MKKLVLILAMAIFGAFAVGMFPAQSAYAWEDDKNKDKKKDPAGPPVVEDKKKPPKPKDPRKDPPKKDKKPDEESG
jgi:hypothetical protein